MNISTLSISVPADSSLLTRLQKKIATARFLTISLLFHAILVSVGGSVVLFKMKQDTPDFEASADIGFLSTEVEAPPQPPDPIELIQPPALNLAEPAAAPAGMSSLNLVSTAASATTVLPVGLKNATNFGDGISKKMMTGVGEGINRSMGKVGGTRMTSMLFGQKVEAHRLGVILDVSASLHRQLPEVMNEITKKFENVATVLVFGCGMKPTFEGRVVPLDEVVIEETSDAKNSIRGAYAKIPEFKKHYDKLVKQKNAWYVFPEARYGSISGQIVGTHLAFEKLIKEKCDVIYWFSDFHDRVDPDVAKKLASQLKAAKVTVFAHRPVEEKEFTEGQAEIIRETKGKIITGFQ